MECKKCGNEIHAGEQFCSKCGNKINNSDNRKHFELTIYQIILLIIVIFIIIVTGIMIYNNSSNKISVTSQTTSRETSSTNISTDNTINNKLDLNDVQMNTTFTSTNGMNSVTKKVVNCALSYLNYNYPNFKWSQIEITQKDNYGRYWVVVNYVKSSASERVDFVGIMVWIKDVNDDSKMGYYYSGSVIEKSNGWGTPLTDEGE